MSPRLTSIYGTLAVADASAPPELLSAHAYALGWAQAVARAAGDDPASAAYFDTMALELSRVAWTVIEAGSVNYDQTAREVAPAEIVSALLDAGSGDASTARVDRLFAAAASRTPPAGLANLLGFWWAQSAHFGGTSMAVGPVEIDGRGGMSTSIVWLDFAYASNGWGSLFVKRRADRLDVSARRLKRAFAPALWAAAGPGVEARLRDQAEKFIRTLTLDL